MVVWVIAGGVLIAAAVAASVTATVRSSARARRDRRAAALALTGDQPRLPIREGLWRDDPAAPVREEPTAEANPAGRRDRATSPHDPANNEPLRPPSQWSPDEVEWLMADTMPGNYGARTVMTPDGPMFLTTPPFRLRRSVLTHRERAYARALSVMIPSGYVLCPQVRLEGLVTPTHPDGRAVEDFRNWRRRVRLRAIDFVICRVPDWSPIVALEVESPEKTVKPFQRDRLIDETLAEVGLPLIRCSGTPREDWALIKPYLKPQPARAANNGHANGHNGQPSNDASDPGQAGQFDAID